MQGREPVATSCVSLPRHHAPVPFGCTKDLIMSQSVLAVELSAGVAIVRVLRGFSGVNWLVCRGDAGFARGELLCWQGVLPCLCGPKTLPPAVVAATCSE